MTNLKLKDFELHEFDTELNKEIVYKKNDFTNIVNKLSKILKREFNVKEGKVVSVILPTSVFTSALTLALINIGAIVNNLFYSYGKISLETRLKLVNPDFVISKKEKIITLTKKLNYIEESNLNNLLELEKDDYNDFSIVLDDKLMFLHFTSGTTGLPKIVPHKKRDLIGVLDTIKNVFEMKNTDKYICTADYGWVTGIYYNIFLPILSNSTTFIIKNMNGFYLLKSLKLFKKWGITKLYTSPTFLKMSLSFFKKNKLNLNIFTVGEKLPYYIKETLVNLNYKVVDTWWQTELGCVTIFDTKETNTMGKPLKNVKIALLKNKKIIQYEEAKNISGELLIDVTSHKSIMEGYYKNDEVNEKKFIDKYYKTGDIVKITDDKNIIYVSRADDVIIKAGELISPDEIESYVMKEFKIDEAVVLTDSKNNIILFCTGTANEELIKEKIRLNLNSIMEPKKIIFVDKIPKTKSGKVQRNLLKENLK